MEPVLSVCSLETALMEQLHHESRLAATEAHISAFSISSVVGVKMKG